MQMKFFVSVGISVVSASSFTIASACIEPDQALKRIPDFRSKSIAEAFFSIPVGIDASSEDILKNIDKALDQFEMTPEGETAFLRRRLIANTGLRNKDEAEKDIDRLIQLDRLAKNEKEFLMQYIDYIDFEPPEFDTDIKPLVRFPASFPSRVQKSGHCFLIYDINEKGKPKNIKVGYCTDEVFSKKAVKSLKKWKYEPAMRDDVPVLRKTAKTKIRFQLADECGNILPE